MSIAKKLKRPSALASAIVLAIASLVPVFVNQTAAAYGLLTSREIRMSSSSVSAGNDVTYLVRMTTPTTSNIGGLVIDFCSNSPIIGDTCTAPTGFNTNKATLALANQTGITDFAVDTVNSTASKVVLTRTAASFTAGTLTLELGGAGGADGITNPTTSNSTFYGRMLTYTTTAGAQAYTSTSIGAEPPLVHAGGTALSTADTITIQSKVQERLTFCVYTGASSYATCALSATNPVVLGDANGVLDPSNAYVSTTTKYNVTTNASNGVTIRAKGTTLTSGANTITGIGASAAASSPGTEQFGFCNYRDAGGGVAGLTPAAPYDHASCSSTTQGINGSGGASFAFDATTACGSTASAANFGEGNLGCLYGDVIANKTAGAYSTGVVAFLGNIANTTEPGIYTTTMTFIATGNY